jgi:hypothetical protein
MKEIHTQKGLPDREIVEADPKDLGLVRVTTCGVSGMLATDACRHDVNGYSTVTDWWRDGTQPTTYCPMHQEYKICTETGLLASEYCPRTTTTGAVFIPYGHPLYNYTKTHASTIEKYLGKFATLNVGSSTSERAAILNQMVCTVHTAAWEPVYEYPSAQPTSPGLYSEAQALISDAYVQLSTLGYTLSTTDYRAFANVIIEAEQALYGGATESALQFALQNLRAAMATYR